jgi:hypothetical protein
MKVTLLPLHFKNSSWFFLCFALVAILLPRGGNAESEEERLQHYHKNNYTWPITEFVPNNPGWNKLMQHRLRQVEEIEDYQERFESFVQTLSASFIQKNYTEWGFGLARAPDDLMEALRQGIRDGLAEGPKEEYHISAITEPRPWFIDRPDLTSRVRKCRSQNIVSLQSSVLLLMDSFSVFAGFKRAAALFGNLGWN